VATEDGKEILITGEMKMISRDIMQVYRLMLLCDGKILKEQRVGYSFRLDIKIKVYDIWKPTSVHNILLIPRGMRKK